VVRFAHKVNCAVDRVVAFNHVDVRTSIRVVRRLAHQPGGFIMLVEDGLNALLALVLGYWFRASRRRKGRINA
jgi:hypothetical protein